jgi:hypothetical protein
MSKPEVQQQDTAITPTRSNVMGIVDMRDVSDNNGESNLDNHGGAVAVHAAQTRRRKCIPGRSTSSFRGRRIIFDSGGPGCVGRTLIAVLGALPRPTQTLDDNVQRDTNAFKFQSQAPTHVLRLSPLHEMAAIYAALLFGHCRPPRKIVSICNAQTPCKALRLSGPRQSPSVCLNVMQSFHRI